MGGDEYNNSYLNLTDSINNYRYLKEEALKQGGYCSFDKYSCEISKLNDKLAEKLLTNNTKGIII